MAPTVSYHGIHYVAVSLLSLYQWPYRPPPLNQLKKEEPPPPPDSLLYGWVDLLLGENQKWMLSALYNLFSVAVKNSDETICERYIFPMCRASGDASGHLLHRKEKVA